MHNSSQLQAEDPALKRNTTICTLSMQAYYVGICGCVYVQRTVPSSLYVNARMCVCMSMGSSLKRT